MWSLLAELANNNLRKQEYKQVQSSVWENYDWQQHLIILTGTIFLEIWKRKTATLAYEWDVDNFEDSELDRPQFVGTKVKKVSCHSLVQAN